MRFENKHIKILIEKKQLSEEQKAERKLKRKKYRPAAAIALVLIAAIIGVTAYSCLGAPRQVAWEDFELEEGEYIASSKLAAGIRNKYGEESIYGYTYGTPIENIGRDQAIVIELGYNALELGLDYWSEIYALYEDSALTRSIGESFSYDEETKILSITPSMHGGACEISTLNMDVETVNKYPHDLYHLFPRGSGENWGNLGTAYLACYRDEKTGEKLETPIVSIVTFKGEIEEALVLDYSITEDGRPEFYWSEVEGAQEYMVCKTSRSDGGGYGSLTVLGITEETSWKTPAAEFGSFATTNDIFRTFDISEDDWKDEDMYEWYVEKYKEPGIPHYSDGEFASHYGICVIAVNQEGTSMISNSYDAEELASNLPYSPARYAEKENGIRHSAGVTYETVQEIPVYDYVTMCDGYTVTKLIHYDTEGAYVQEERYITVDDETGEYIKGETLPCLYLPYQVQGTPFYYMFTIVDYDEENLEADMALLEEREANLSRKSGTVTPGLSKSFATHEDLKVERISRPGKEEESHTVPDIFANSALSEYLAVNMLRGTEVIDLRDFPEARDGRMVDDAFLEAYYQNPMILGVSGYRLSKNGTALRVIYDETAQSQADKQRLLKQKVGEIVDRIITEDMSDREKELAINEYLREHIVYDDAALENAEENNFAGVDEQYNDSFTAYGALLEGKCVCAGYAAAFKLLAQEAGLECIVVTGILDGSLAHAWNKVKLDNEWQIVDTTNNDNDFIVNALFNLPDDIGDRILVEDKDYVLDAKLPQYTSQSEANEYYHITKSYFPVREVADELVADLKEKGEARLRTDYGLDDREFRRITDTIFERMGEDIDLYGYYWLGVIYLEVK